VNLSQRFTAGLRVHPAHVYQWLVRNAPARYGAYLNNGDYCLISNSPELFLRIDGRRITTRPIKGTRPLGDGMADELLASAKDAAELNMIVDLERNDLGRVCTYGSVQVTRLMDITEYAHVLHIESEVTGQLAPGVEPLDVVGALFPGGTITGVPKIRTMQLITELEPNTRGLYTGSLGYFSFAGGMDLNIVIRTLLVKDGRAYTQVGGGIVHDSEPRQEYKETLNKARSQLLALSVCGRAG
jgi:anthranilate/para-aminobenzoate synthase component I